MVQEVTSPHCIMGLLLLKIAIKMAAELHNIARDKKTKELRWPPIAQYCARGERNRRDNNPSDMSYNVDFFCFPDFFWHLINGLIAVPYP